MKDKKDMDNKLFESIKKMEKYLEASTGQKPTQEEMAKALTRYFVLKEIREFIEMEREEKANE